MKYRHLHGYKYELLECVTVASKCPNLHEPHIIIKDGEMFVRGNYAWDGPSGLGIDTPNFMRGSLIHDAYYQLMREGHLDAKKWRKYADEELRRICIEDGMSKFRAWYVYRAVRIWGKWTCKPRKNPRGKIVEI